MRKNSFSHIRKWLLIYLVLVVIGTTLIYLLTYQEISATLLSQGGPFAANAGQSADSWITALQVRILFLLTAGAAIVILSGILWFRLAGRRLIWPIRIIQKSIYRLSRGKLNETVTLTAADEFGQIGSNINELAANLQELLLYVWKQTGQCLDLLDEININAQESGQNPKTYAQLSAEDCRRLAEMTYALKDLREMAKAYVFYDVQLAGEQTLAINDPGQIQPVMKACNE
jgi:methyl-accepting chemotaxis protein